MPRTAADLPLLPDEASPRLPRRTIGLIVLYLALLWSLSAAGRFLPNLLRQDRYDDDASQHVWWTYKFANPALYPHDEMARFMSGAPFAPWGYLTLYRLAVPHIDAQRFSESIPFVLSALFLGVAFLIGRRAGGSVMAGAIVATLAASRLYFDHFQGGFPRTFGLLTMTFAMWALMARRLGLLGLSFFAAALFYPPCLVPPGMCAAVLLGWEFARTQKLPRGWWLLLGLGLIAAVMLLAFMRGQPKEFGPTVTAAEARTLPEFGPNGRAEYFGVPTKTFWFDSQLSGIGSPMGEGLILTGAVVVSVLIFGNFVPAEGWVLLIGSAASFVIAHLIIFRLFVPNRHVQYPLVVFRLIWMAALTGPVLALIQKQFVRWPAIEKFKWPIIAVVAIGILIGTGSSSLRRMNKELRPPVDQDMENALAFIRGLPIDTVAAAHPWDADAIPLRTQHSIVACWETYHPYWDGYYRYIQPRVAATMKAQYASDWKDIAPLHDLYRADVYLVNTDRYWENKSIWFCRPFTASDVDAVAAGREKGFALLNVPADRVLYRSGRMSVVRLSP